LSPRIRKACRVKVLSEEKVSLETCKELVSGEIATRGLIAGFLVKALRDRYGDEIIETVKMANYESGKVAGGTRKGFGRE